MKRNVLTIVLAMLMLGLTACQKTNQEAVIGGANEATGVVVTKPTESPTQEPTQEPTQAPTATPTVVSTATPEPKDKETEFEIEVEYEENSLYALKYLGYELESTGYNTELVSLPGDEYYLVVPRYEGMQISIYENTLADTEEYKEEKFLRYSSNNAKPIVVQGNQSDIFANIVIELVYDDKTTEFSPYISCKDGSVSTTDEKGVIIE